MEPRPYHDPTDLQYMRDLLVAGQRSGASSYYIHPGDLNWWLFYPPEPESWAERIFLWESSPGDLLGWALLSPAWRTFDVFIHPAQYGQPQASEMYAWASRQAEIYAELHSQPAIRTIFVSENDLVLRDLLHRWGFVSDEHTSVVLKRALDEAMLSEPALPSGYCVRPVAGEHEAQLRAMAAHGAFGSSLPFAAYCPRYLKFMQSPVYPAGWDLVVETPDGQFAAFCVCWLDYSNLLGNFEPVGTHPDFQRRGLGKAVMQEGLRRMAQAGMRTAIVSTNADNQPAIRLYEALDFRITEKLITYVKIVEVSQ